MKYEGQSAQQSPNNHIEGFHNKFSTLENFFKLLLHLNKVAWYDFMLPTNHYVKMSFFGEMAKILKSNQ